MYITAPSMSALSRHSSSPAIHSLVIIGLPASGVSAHISASLSEFTPRNSLHFQHQSAVRELMTSTRTSDKFGCFVSKMFQNRCACRFCPDSKILLENGPSRATTQPTPPHMTAHK